MSDTDAGENAEGGASGGFLSTTKGLVTGLTSLVVAVTGLMVACDKLVPTEESAPVAAVAAGSAAKAADGPAAAASPEEEGDPILYTGDKLRMEWDGKAWQLNSPDGAFTYEEMTSTVDNWVLAFDKSNDEYIRWPIAGGTMEYSRDDRQSWISYGEVAPKDE